jgi:hypothetical protein
MPLQHREDGPDLKAAPERVMRSAAFTDEAPERPRNTLATDPTVLADRKVHAAQKRLDKLVAANAAGAVIGRAQRALDDARLDVLERAAERNAATRAAAVAAQRETQRLRTENEIHFRMSKLAPVIGVVFCGLRLNMFPERSTDATVRSIAYGDWHKILQAIASATQQAAGIASRASAPLQVLPVDQPHFRALVEDLARRSLKHGLLSIEEI